jgi:hypothetical protein
MSRENFDGEKFSDIGNCRLWSKGSIYSDFVVFENSFRKNVSLLKHGVKDNKVVRYRLAYIGNNL